MDQLKAYSMYSRSSMAKREPDACAADLGTEILKIGRILNVRWSPSSYVENCNRSLVVLQAAAWKFHRVGLGLLDQWHAQCPAPVCYWLQTGVVLLVLVLHCRLKQCRQHWC